jgi:hypothetical protein
VLEVDALLDSEAYAASGLRAPLELAPIGFDRRRDVHRHVVGPRDGLDRGLLAEDRDATVTPDAPCDASVSVTSMTAHLALERPRDRCARSGSNVVGVAVDASIEGALLLRRCHGRGSWPAAGGSGYLAAECGTSSRRTAERARNRQKATSRPWTGGIEVVD